MNHVDNLNEVSEEQIPALTEALSAELSEDMKVIGPGPGQMLAEARVIMGFTQQDVADKLNFHITLVNNIENEAFDSKLPETFNRGYLRNYAKFVNASQDDVLASYEQLNIAKAQASELQSFSKGTEKLAESNRIMWVSYLILAILIGASVVWWMQNSTTKVVGVQPAQPIKVIEKNIATDVSQVDAEKNKLAESVIEAPDNTFDSTIVSVEVDNSITQKRGQELSQESTEQQIESADELAPETQSEVTLSGSSPLAETDQGEVILTNVTFTFSGDCWVNISDASGERIAWGVKKLGYIMKISGQAPFSVTLGKPELVAINFADKNIDMSQFNAGNIAKFTLPIAN